MTNRPDLDAIRRRSEEAHEDDGMGVRGPFWDKEAAVSAADVPELLAYIAELEGVLQRLVQAYVNDDLNAYLDIMPTLADQLGAQGSEDA